ncbi:tetratricopeptide repeat protein [Pseudoalteromonas undina]|uniref:tetratricopeptide repeat protein n=1 Tax=Pseudoalteromonas undina TaxID=43660 RepID=UPI00186619C0|nr:tetratricopeptide repeat protein [Pseudoalteromonas undina]
MSAVQGKHYLLAVCLLSLSACSTTNNANLSVPIPIITPPMQLQQQPIESELQIFQLDQSLKQQLSAYVQKNKSADKIAYSLLSFLLTNGDNSLSYQSTSTQTASQSYQNLNANCLSLSILAYSLAEHLGLKARFQKVHVPEYWALNQGFNLLTGHINLAIDNKTKLKDSSLVYQRNKRLIIDFDPNSRQARFATSSLSKKRVTAMFYNNKGGEALVNKHYDLAYSYFKAAINTDASFSASWGNLGVLFKQLDDLKQAEKMYSYAIALNANDNTAQGNLALLYKLTNRVAEGEKLLAKLDKKRQENPYYHISLGNSDYVNGDYANAISHYKKANAMSPTLHESHFGLARSYFELNNITRAEFHLRKARKKADFDHEKQRYDNKLIALKSLTAKANHH